MAIPFLPSHYLAPVKPGCIWQGWKLEKVFTRICLKLLSFFNTRTKMGIEVLNRNKRELDFVQIRWIHIWEDYGKEGLYCVSVSLKTRFFFFPSSSFSFFFWPPHRLTRCLVRKLIVKPKVFSVREISSLNLFIYIYCFNNWKYVKV